MDKVLQLFVIGCMGSRFLLVYLAKNSSLLILKIMGLMAIMVAIVFMSIYLFNLRKIGIGGQVIWWDSLRPFHALTYTVFAYMALLGIQEYAWKVLLIDVIFGLMAFLIHHMNEFI